MANRYMTTFSSFAEAKAAGVERGHLHHEADSKTSGSSDFLGYASQLPWILKLVGSSHSTHTDEYRTFFLGGLAPGSGRSATGPAAAPASARGLVE